jgi:hypothetical protein
MELKVRFITNITPYMPLSSLYSLNLRSHFNNKGLFVYVKVSKRNYLAGYVSKIALDELYNKS